MYQGIDVRPGDILNVEGRGLLFRGIKFVQWVRSHDGAVEHGHSAIISERDGKLLDTLWSVCHTHLSQYSGQNAIIARAVRTKAGGVIPESTMLTCLRDLEIRDLGKWYPGHRLLFHLSHPVAKFLRIGWFRVCSERSAGYLRDIGARPWTPFGVTPDMLTDEFRTWRNYEIIFDSRRNGLLP